MNDHISDARPLRAPSKSCKTSMMPVMSAWIVPSRISDKLLDDPMMSENHEEGSIQAGRVLPLVVAHDS